MAVTTPETPPLRGGVKKMSVRHEAPCETWLNYLYFMIIFFGTLFAFLVFAWRTAAHQDEWKLYEHD